MYLTYKYCVRAHMLSIYRVPVLIDIIDKPHLNHINRYWVFFLTMQTENYLISDLYANLIGQLIFNRPTRVLCENCM